MTPPFWLNRSCRMWDASTRLLFLVISTVETRGFSSQIVMSERFLDQKSSTHSSPTRPASSLLKCQRDSKFTRRMSPYLLVVNFTSSIRETICTILLLIGNAFLQDFVKGRFRNPTPNAENWGLFSSYMYNDL